MEHNHPPDPPDTSTLVDCTESFKHIFPIRFFDSLQDLEAKIHELERVCSKFEAHTNCLIFFFVLQLIFKLSQFYTNGVLSSDLEVMA